MFGLGATALAVVVVLLGVTSDIEIRQHILLGQAMLVLAALPFLLWLRQGGNRFPAFEAMLALTANAYALPLLTGHSHLSHFTPETITRAALTVLVFQTTSLATYLMVRGRPGRSRFWTESIVGPEAERWISFGIILSAIYQAVVRFTELVPPDLESVLRAVFYGLGVLSTFVTAQRWGRGELKLGERVLFGVALGAQVLVIGTGLLLISAVTLCGIGLLGYISGGRRLPWIGAAAIFVAFAVLHNGKTAMREKYWSEGRPPPTFSEIPAFYAEWVAHGLDTPLVGGADDSAGARLLDRTSLLHVLSLVVHYSPELQPYKDGATYRYVLPQLIPRFVWPDKPRSHIATYELSIYYGLQDEESTARTTIAFGLLAEAYANYGIVGAAVLGALFGFVYKKLQRLSLQSPIFSLAGILMIILTAWSLSAEVTMAAWVSSLFQALIVALGLPLLLRQLTGP